MPIGDLLAQISGGQSQTPVTSAYVAPPPKRKADNDLGRGSDKIVKRETASVLTPRSTVPDRVPTSASSSSRARPPQPSSLVSATKAVVPKSASATTTIQSAKQDATKVPKKGSFAEIMARAKAAQTTMSQVGKIQHKRIEKAPSKREREEMKSSSKDVNGKPKAKKSPPLRDGRNGTRENGKGSRPTSSEPEKRVKKAAVATTGYTGTARPNPTTTKKAPQSYGSSGRDRDRGSNSASRSRYTYAASEDEEEDEEEDYETDVSSDMEAAVFEVDEEEERAGRLARKEDALALAEENRLKREKEEKRRRLAAMAKNRR